MQQLSVDSIRIIICERRKSDPPGFDRFCKFLVLRVPYPGTFGGQDAGGHGLLQSVVIVDPLGHSVSELKAYWYIGTG